MPGNLERLLELVAPVLFFGGLGAAAGWWIQRLVRRKRLRKLGFTADDLRSKEGFFKRWGEITAKQIPERISFNEIPSHSWSKASRYAESKTAFESLGFQRNATFIASPQKWVGEVWLSNEHGLFAMILDSPTCGIHSEVMIEYNDGSTVSFENTEECGHRHLERHDWIHCGLITRDKLFERALRDRQPEVCW